MKDRKLWKVLIVDNEEDWVERYEKWVQQFVSEHNLGDYFDKEVKRAYNGEESFNLIKKDKDINIVFADVFMEPNCKRLCAPPDDPEKPFGGIWLVREIKYYVNLLKEKFNPRDIRCLLISDKGETDQYLKKWFPQGLESEGFIKFVEKFPRERTFKEELFDKTFFAFVEIANIAEVITNFAHSEIIAIGSKMRSVLEKAKKVSNTDTTVLLLGETGTGKELFAGFIRGNSLRANKPFIKVNCAAIPDTLLESELFGHEKGAFTGAAQRRIGRFEEANGGTIFIDEIGDLSPGTQVKLLRILQEKEFQRLGSNVTNKTNVRVIAATHRDLEEEIRQGRFREDLYYRVNVVPIELPPLREIKEEIPFLIDHFLLKENQQKNCNFKISYDTKEKMLAYDWPGNIRELQNIIERAVVLDNEKEIIIAIQRQRTKTHSEPIKIPPEGIDLRLKTEEMEKDFIMEALRMTKGIQAEAAKLLKVNARTFGHLCEKYSLNDYIESLKRSE